MVIARSAVAGEGKPYRVPFHTANGMILLDATVNDKPAVLLLDTGSVKTMISFEALGHGEIHVKLGQASIGRRR